MVMALIEIKTRKKKKIRIALVEEEDYKQLTKKRFYFSWKLFKTQADIKVYKLQLINDDDILGVMALGNFVDESRIEINLLACSVENVGVKRCMKV
ncbi:hypothetical protein [Niabella hibiscisoli]|uniref:hypothetical protein n=1 Tax=Niabella hibiscisoli TaxID=1825928 RepID=UPI001F114A6A|nr:hypothetical protein [Niabella hibiscisoli]MCH5720004.1 hypothetical protein [Niabella hibiscisoli]